MTHKDLIINAAIKHFEAERDMAVANAQIYLDKPSGIGEHSNVAQEFIAQVKKVAEALIAIKNGDYGYCRRCDEPIASARLAAQPEANLCLLCQDKVDRQQ